MINISMTCVKHIEEVVSRKIFSLKKQTWLSTFDNITIYQTRRLMSVCVKLGEQGGGGGETIVVSEGVIKGGFGIELAQRAL